MTRIQIAVRIHKVFDSCRTDEQADVAEKYCKMLVKRFYKKTCPVFSFSFIFSWPDEARDLFSLVTAKKHTYTFRGVA